ncbi:MAG: UDP-3-O-acyl-N-acetylglucosamine deacetylase [Patescibacteria group bacterium]|jgi:UDP-3-O-[3-hydroxymyristoyl] N-acetylglucosamine deacetylase
MIKNINRPAAEFVLLEEQETTLDRPVGLDGISVKGKPCRAEILPASAGHGVVFDVAGVLVPATLAAVVPGSLHTTVIGAAGATVRTVEHLLAAFAGLGLDNALIKVGADGIPFHDFSAQYFAERLASGGRRALEARRQGIRINEPISFTEEDGAREVAFRPSVAGRAIAEAITEFPAPVGRQIARFVHGETDFSQEVAWARSFVRTPLDAAGDKWSRVRRIFPMLPDDPAKSPLIAFDGNGYLTPLRQPDELGRHKLLDFLGDYFLLGRRVIGEVRLLKPGHAFNVDTARRLLELASAAGRG